MSYNPFHYLSPVHDGASHAKKGATEQVYTSPNSKRICCSRRVSSTRQARDSQTTSSRAVSLPSATGKVSCAWVMGETIGTCERGYTHTYAHTPHYVSYCADLHVHHKSSIRHVLMQSTGAQVLTRTSSVTGCVGGVHTRGVTSFSARGTGAGCFGMVATYFSSMGMSVSRLTLPVSTSLNSAGL